MRVLRVAVCVAVLVSGQALAACDVGESQRVVVGASNYGVVQKVEARGNGLFRVRVGALFDRLDIDEKTGMLAAFNCVLRAGKDDAYYTFILHDARSGKRVGQYIGGRVKMD